VLKQQDKDYNQEGKDERTYKRLNDELVDLSHEGNEQSKIAPFSGVLTGSNTANDKSL